MGITVMKIFILGGILPALWRKNKFFGFAEGSPYNEISDRKTNDIPPQMKVFNTVIP